MLFRNKRDRKVINVDPKKESEENMDRQEIQTGDYTQIVLYDHLTRRKNAWFIYYIILIIWLKSPRNLTTTLCVKS